MIEFRLITWHSKKDQKKYEIRYPGVHHGYSIIMVLNVLYKVVNFKMFHSFITKSVCPL